MKHKHDEVIRAYLDGKDIEYSSDGRNWATININDYVPRSGLPPFSYNVEYRIAPKALKYRVSLHEDRDGFYIQLSTRDLGAQSRPTFVKWLTDWVEVEM